MHLSITQLMIYGFVSFVASVLSGIAGAGGGFIMTPLLIFFGLSPAQAVATGKFSGLSVSIGSLQGLKGVKVTSKRRLITVIVLASLIGVISPFFIRTLDSDLYKDLLGIILILLIPTLFLRKDRLQRLHSSSRSVIGYALIALAFLLQGIFSGGLGMIVSVVLIAMFGMSALEANLTKRYSQLLLNTIIILGVLFSHLIVWEVVVVGVITSFIGGLVGGRMAIKRGDMFVTIVMALLMLASAIWLIVS